MRDKIARQMPRILRLISFLYKAARCDLTYRTANKNTRKHSGHRYPQCRLAITLRFLGHDMSFVATSHELSLGATTVRNVVYEGISRRGLRSAYTRHLAKKCGPLPMNCIQRVE
ncbi:hypothetical protein Q1695_009141 [Nippostrongylus brasiliensis]|nr:hypothetical protein Q1695_009141 [Nippostrongylus brasiliensis]